MSNDEKVNKKADKTTAVSVLKIFTGSFLIVLFGIIALIGRVWTLITDGGGISMTAVLFLISLIVGAFLIGSGYKNYKLAGRFRRVKRAMGEDTSITLSELEQRLDWNRDKLLKALRRQTARGFWPEAFLDTVGGTFVLGYDPSDFTTNSGNETLDELLGTANGHINELAAINRSLEDAELALRVDTLIDIAKQIYGYIEKNPEKSCIVRQLSNYLLPTTTKLLASYLNLQNKPVKSENMLDAMQKIKDAMSTIEAAFAKQLDSLYSEKTMDISVEIEVMEKMLEA